MNSDEDASTNDKDKIDDHVVEQAPVTNAKAEREQKKVLEQLSKDNAKLSMEVLIHSPFREYYNGPAFSVTAENATGPFDILPQHHNFISLINACDIVVRTVSEGEQRFSVSGGIMHVKADKLVVFLDV
ncbi:MAG: hypothetical protein AAB436_02340 [Patescibacteria group bacterium]